MYGYLPIFSIDIPSSKLAPLVNKSKDSWEVISEVGAMAILSVAESGGRVSVSTTHGIYLHDGPGRKWQKLASPDAFVSDTIALDGDRLWLGGWREVMWYDIPSGQIRKFTEEDAQGLSRVRVHDIRNSSRYVWVATDGGIYRYNTSISPELQGYLPHFESRLTLCHD